MLKANCRARFTAEDFDFVVSTLSRKREDAVPLADLLADQETRDLVLDNEVLYKELIDQCGCLKVSAYLYFYILMRQNLKRAGLQDRELADYIALMLAVFGRRAAEENGVTDSMGQPYISDLLIALTKAGPSEGFMLRAHIADCSLFISGIFAERVKERHERRGGPDLGFYEEMGQSNYRFVSQHRLAARTELAPIFDMLAKRFHEVRCALNHVSDNIFHLSNEDRMASMILQP